MQQQLVQPAWRRPAQLRVQLARTTIMSDEDASGAYRTLGISEDSTYDEIMNKYMELAETYAGDTARLAAFEAAKEKVLDDKLRARMAGTLRPVVEDSPFDEKPVVRTPPWEIAYEYGSKLFELPTKRHARQVITTMGAMTLGTWFAPNVAGTVLLLNVMAGLGFIYNRGTAEVPRDDYGQIGEIRPMKPKPMVLASAITFALWTWGYLKAKRMVALMVIPASFEGIMRCNLISSVLIVASLFVKVHAVFGD